MKAVLAIIAGLSFWIGTAFGQTTWYVDDDACPGTGTGSEQDPFCRIQSGIEAAVAGDTVLVAPGAYVENITFRGWDIVVVSEAGPKETIIDGFDSGSVISFTSSESLNCVLDGFTLINGRASKGGGVHIRDSSPTIQNCFITNNEATSSLRAGGGIYCANSAANITANIISNNHAADWGGGIVCVYPCHATISRNVIANNSTPWQGGGIACSDESSPTIRRNQIYENTAGDNGGGVFVTWSATPLVDGNVITRNSALKGGGVFALTDTDQPTGLLTNNIIAWNSATRRGGGIYPDVAFRSSFLPDPIRSGQSSGRVLQGI